MKAANGRPRGAARSTARHLSSLLCVAASCRSSSRLAGACLIGLLVYGVTTQSASRTLDEAVAQGQHPAAPAGHAHAARALRRCRGHRASLAAYQGKVVVLNFWASWCEPCQTEAPLLERAQGQLASATTPRCSA